MVKIVDFVAIFDDGARKRHHHETEKDKVVYFAVQLEIRVKDKWRVVLRYDCSHSFLHMDKYNIKGKQTK